MNLYIDKINQFKGKFLYGHPGYGGSNIMVSADDQLVIAYISNGLKSGSGELNRSYRLLRNAAFECIKQ